MHSVKPIIADSDFRLIIVDNKSTDSSCALIQQYIKEHTLEKSITLYPATDNHGFGKGCNKGAQIASTYGAEYLWFLNPDTQINQDSGAQLLSLLQESEHIDFAGSILNNEKNEPRAGAFRFPGIMNTLISSMQLKILDNLFPKYTTAAPIEAKPYPSDWLTGASFMTSATCFEKLDGFDPVYFLYFEEVDLFHRAKKIGLTAWCCPQSSVFHIAGASTGINNKTQEKRKPFYWFESRRHFYINNYGRIYFTITDLCLLTSTYCWKLRAKLQKKVDNTPAHFAKDIFKHSYLASLLKK
ncbi:glycosyl transferase, group 2 family protein [gamma proteobacterium IMCC1989]|nr:glycosyl transferase, group 2 family protein [gamma proteobacterium IMCC1989]